MADTYTNLIYHLVFSTKNREPLITPDIRDKLYQYIGGIITGENGILISIGGIMDHIHLAVKMKPTASLSDMMRIIKCNSSKWMNENNDNEYIFKWQKGYGAFTVSESQLRILINYINNQEKHHRKKNFKEEMIDVLNKHKIEYDEKYLWD